MKLKTNRVIYLDLMRALGVFLMVEGHTVDTLLAPVYRTNENGLYLAWRFVRGFTAPIFMFTAGVVFVYLFFLNGLNFKENPRVKKGIKRFFTLLFIGYLLRYPSWKIVDFSIVTQKQWLTFFVVDALHLIGFGILTLVALLYLSSKLKTNFSIISLLAALLVLGLTVVFRRFSWEGVPIFLANYFTVKFGSLFPLFPWLAYLIFGGILGKALAKNKELHKNFKFGLALIVTGIILIALFLIFNNSKIPDFSGEGLEEIKIFILRLGGTLLLNGLAALAVLKLKSLPRLLILLGRNTLFIYVAHLVVLYGSPWSKGLNFLIGAKLTFLETIFSVILMFAFVIGLVVTLNEIKIKRKKKLEIIKTPT